MLNFISSLFAPSETSTTDLDEELVNQAIERAVDGTDVRLRAVRDYKKRLREPVISAIEHIIAMADDIPAATELSPEAYSDDPRLRTFFASPKRISEVAGSFPSIRKLRRSGAKPVPENLYGLLSMEWGERNVLGMDTAGGQVRRGVAQVVVNFSNYRFLCPSATEEESRRAIKQRVYDYVLAEALSRIVDMREQRTQLKHKLDVLNAGQWGLESMFSPEESESSNEAALELEVEALDKELEKLGGDTGSLDVALDLLSDSLMNVETSLSLQPLELSLDYRGVKATDPSAKGINTVKLTQVHAQPDKRRIILMCRLPDTALPEKKDFLREAQRLLS